MSGRFGDRRHAQLATLARNWWALVLRGVIAVIFGILAFLQPAAALGSIVLFGGIYLLVDGVFAAVAAVRAATHHERWMLLLLEGVLGVALGLIALGQPVVAIGVAVQVISIWAFVTGVLMLAAALRLHHGRWLLGLGGVVSIIWGVMLFTNPFGGAIVLTIWLGAYAAIFGVTMIAAGLRLRSWHTRGRLGV